MTCGLVDITGSRLTSCSVVCDTNLYAFHERFVASREELSGFIDKTTCADVMCVGE